MASLALTTFAAALTLVQLSSCKKVEAQVPTPNCPNATYPAAGVYNGTHLTDQISHAPAKYELVLNNDGTLLIKVQGVPPAQTIIYGKGSWILSGNMVSYTDTTINYSSTLIQKGKFTFSDTGVLTNGTWQDVSADGGVYYTGTFSSFQRIN